MSHSFHHKIVCLVLIGTLLASPALACSPPEEDLSDETLSTAVFDLYKNREAYINTMEKSSLSNAVETITGLIESCVSHS